ncbi:tetratricopeptide repeat-containing sensor histidine kinase [Flavobacterium eburneipallidum]|uniref:tetratricopeptide repeat-containing sensor histidine kinase n=1 Tax=Flavobacterium eburneipallidum TaxID=3003263 RepID=UPI002483250E|nr:sensor histidine kinase [Flavobacterium eburneipallidum]
MRKRIFFLFFMATFYSYSQNAQEIINGLKEALKEKPDIKKTAVIYSDLTWYYSSISLDSAMVYGKKAITESIKTADSTLIAQVYSDVGAVYFRKGDYQNSKKNYLNAYKIRKKKKDYAGMAKVKANLANIYNKLGDKKLALKTYLETVDFFEKTGNYDALSLTKANIGLLFLETRNYPKAKNYLKDAITYQEKNGQHTGLCTSYLTLGNVYLKMKDTLKALTYYNKCIVVSKKTGNKLSLSSALVNIGGIKSNQVKSQEANSLLSTSQKIRNDLNIKNEESALTLLQIKEKISASRFDEAKKDLLKLKKVYENDPNEKEGLLETYFSLVSVYGYIKISDSVSFYADKSAKLQVEIQETAVVKQTAELETKYQTTKKEKLLLQKEAEAKQKNEIIIGISFLAFFTALIAFLIYRQQKLKNKQQEQEFELKTAISKIENQNKLQEQRLNISRDLHDNIGSQLTFIISSVDNVKYAFDIDNPKLDDKLTNISSFAKETIVELRDTIWAMNSNEITFEDLESRINNFIEKAKEAKDEIQFSFAKDMELKDTKFTSVEGMNIYRTIQEAVNNAIKYADATTISIKVKSIETQIQITIQDNGIGFDEITVQKGNGLQNMQKRIEDIGGKFSLKSSNDGTQIQIWI